MTDDRMMKGGQICLVGLALFALLNLFNYYYDDPGPVSAHTDDEYMLPVIAPHISKLLSLPCVSFICAHHCINNQYCSPPYVGRHLPEDNFHKEMVNIIILVDQHLSSSWA